MSRLFLKAWFNLLNIIWELLEPPSSLTPTVSNILKNALGVSNRWCKDSITSMRELNQYVGESSIILSPIAVQKRTKKINRDQKKKAQEVFRKLLEDVRSALRQKDEILQALAELRETSEPSEATERKRRELQERMEMLPSVDSLALVHYLACGGLIEDAIFCIINLTLECNWNYFYAMFFFRLYHQLTSSLCLLYTIAEFFPLFSH